MKLNPENKTYPLLGQNSLGFSLLSFCPSLQSYSKSEKPVIELS